MQKLIDKIQNKYCFIVYLVKLKISRLRKRYFIVFKFKFDYKIKKYENQKLLFLKRDLYLKLYSYKSLIYLIEFLEWIRLVDMIKLEDFLFISIKI